MKTFYTGLALIVAVSTMFAACSASPLMTGNEKPTVYLNFAASAISRAVEPVQSTARFVALDNSSAKLIVQTEGQADQNYTFDPTSGSVKVKVAYGMHTFIINTYDATGNLLTIGTTTITVGSGINTVNMPMSAAITGVTGVPITLSLGQIIYFTKPASVMYIYSKDAAGAPANSTFWTCASDGSYTDPGSSTSIYTGVTYGTLQIIRVQNVNAVSVNITF